MIEAGEETPEARSSPFARATWFAILVVVAVLAVATARELFIGRAEVGAADAAASRSDWPEVIAHARAAAEAFVPGSPWPERGLRRLQAVGHDAEVRGDDSTAVLAYGAIRTAVFSTRAPGWGGRNRRWNASAEDGLVRVATSRKDAAGQRVSADRTFDGVGRGDTPAMVSLAVLASSTLAMVVGAARLALGGSDGRGARVAQALAAVGFAAYAAVLLVS
jgi:hypothetical protein